MMQQISNVNRIIRIKEVINLTGLSRSTIYRYMASGDFPRSIKLSAHSIGFREVEINGWLAALPVNN